MPRAISYASAGGGRTGDSLDGPGAICAGAVVLQRGLRMQAAQIAAAATIGAGEVSVYRRPRVAVLATGDEIVGVDERPGAGQIRNSNLPMLLALVEQLGCEARSLGTARDDREAIRAAIGRGLESDALFISGGMSMGEYDYVPGLLEEMGVELKITKLKIKPGKPFVFGVGKGAGGEVCYVFGLPGNPVSAYVCSVRLAARILKRLGGEALMERWEIARLGAPLPANGGREFYQPVELDWGAEGMPVARVLNYKGSADVFTLARAQGLLVREANEAARAVGDVVRVMSV